LHTSAAHQRIWQSSSGAQHGAERRVLQHGAGSILAGTRRMGATGGGGGPGKAAPAQVDLSRVGGIGMTRHILRNEGVRGLYRGLGMSLITYTPSSAAWWSFYAVYQVCTCRCLTKWVFHLIACVMMRQLRHILCSAALLVYTCCSCDAAVVCFTCISQRTANAHLQAHHLPAGLELVLPLPPGSKHR
jgi:Mitochondrial carrier protein